MKTFTPEIPIGIFEEQFCTCMSIVHVHILSSLWFSLLLYVWFGVHAVEIDERSVCMYVHCTQSSAVRRNPWPGQQCLHDWWKSSYYEISLGEPITNKEILAWLLNCSKIRTPFIRTGKKLCWNFKQSRGARNRVGIVLSYRAGIFKKSMGARHRVGIGLSYRPARLHRLAEFIPWHQFRGPINI